MKSTVPRIDLFDPDCLCFEPDDVLGGIMKLNPHKSAGPDNVPNKLLIGTFDSLAESLMLIFNESLTNGKLSSS